MKQLGFVGIVALLMAFGSAFAEDSPPTLPDGPVASPPGWECTASGGKVTCVRTQDDKIDP